MTRIFDEKARKEMAQTWRQEDFLYNGIPIREMKVRQVSVKYARKYIATFHYSRTMPDSTRFVYAGYLGDRLAGIICYGMGCGKNQYTSLVPSIQNGEYIELTRLWSPDDMPRNTESKLISESLRMLPPEIKLVLSFADAQQNHVGTIYQATNFIYTGANGGGKMMVDADGIIKHPRLLGIYRMRHPEYKDTPTKDLMELLQFKYVSGGSKHRYVYLRGNKREKKDLRKSFSSKIQSYPKSQPIELTMKEQDVIDQIKVEAIKECYQYELTL